MNRKEYIGRKIAESRKKCQLTQKKIAELTGIDKTTISKIESGKLNVTVDTIDKLCKAVGLELRLGEGIIFEDLVFEEHDFHKLADALGESYPDYRKSKTCYQARHTLKNGINVSVVIGEKFHSNGVDTYEVCLWTKGGWQEVFPYVTDFHIDNILRYAGIIKDSRYLKLLQDEGFELDERGILSYIKKYKDWYIMVNPVGDPYCMFNKEPCNFSGTMKPLPDFESLQNLLESLDEITKTWGTSK